MLTRRDLLKALACASVTGLGQRHAFGAKRTFNYNAPAFGNVSLLHITDVHAQLLPVYFREPSMNLGTGDAWGRPPHIVGAKFLKYYGITPDSAEAYALTHVNFVEAAQLYGKMGGFAHLATLIKQLRADRPNALLLDGGDNWQGSATSIWTKAQDMVDASLQLGVDIMTGHWEFTYGQERVKHVVEHDFKNRLEFIAHNVVSNEFEEPVFKPYVLKEINGVQVAIIGQAFPYTPIANPKFMMPDWSFGIREEALQKTIDETRSKGAAVVVLLSHNGMDVDLKLASRVRGLDAILGGHTHDAVPKALEVKNSLNTTLVINSGSAGKFIGVLDLKVDQNKIRAYRFQLLPVFSNLLPADRSMQDLIERIRKPFHDKLHEKLAVAESLLYRRGTFNGSFDQLILNALMQTTDSPISFSPGFRWGASILPGQTITFEDVMTQTAITYPMVTINELTGERIKAILEDVADNIFHQNPYYQQGGDMVRVGGLAYDIDLQAGIGRRISNMRIDNKPIAANKKYKVAGWASVSQYTDGLPIWDLVANYLRQTKSVNIEHINIPRIKNAGANPGIA